MRFCLENKAPNNVGCCYNLFASPLTEAVGTNPKTEAEEERPPNVDAPFCIGI